MANKKATVTVSSDFYTIRIYINGILHIRYPRSKKIRIQSWAEGDRKSIYKIEIRCGSDHDEYHYESRKVWEDILKALDSAI